MKEMRLVVGMTLQQANKSLGFEGRPHTLETLGEPICAVRDSTRPVDRALTVALDVYAESGHRHPHHEKSRFDIGLNGVRSIHALMLCRTRFTRQHPLVAKPVFAPP
jgi:hypothetical protein